MVEEFHCFGGARGGESLFTSWLGIRRGGGVEGGAEGIGARRRRGRGRK